MVITFFKDSIKKNNKPKVIIAYTRKVAVLKTEDDNNWHYRSPSQDELKSFKRDIEIMRNAFAEQ